MWAMRRVLDPSGVGWSVDVAWTDVRLGANLERRREARERKRRARSKPDSEGAAETAGDRDASPWIDVFTSFIPDELGAIVAVVAVGILVVLAVLAFPWLLVLLLDFAELLAFPLLALVIVGWRVMRRRPFTITAARGRRLQASWWVVGWREARRVERAVADAIVAGGEAVDLFPEYAEPQ
jgi:hypothetical protein